MSKLHTNHIHEVVILSKLPFTTVFTVDKHRARYQFSIFHHVQHSFILLSTHLWANEERYDQREKQFSLISRSLRDESFLDHSTVSEEVKQRARVALSNNNVIMLGDLNLHMRHESRFIYRHGFSDVWMELRGDEQGYTWDSTENRMVHRVYALDNRRMRLDRILLKTGSSSFRPAEIEIRAKESIGCALNYSDHFMLSADFNIVQRGTTYQPMLTEALMPTEKTTGFRPI